MQADRHEAQKSNFRWVIVSILFATTAINYANRAVLSIAEPALAKSLQLNSVSMGYIFSAFGWSYVLAQLPGGWLLDRFGSRKVYAISLFAWSLVTLLTGFAGLVAGTAAVVVLFVLRFLLGVAEAPTFPANSRIAAAWFPTKETATAAAIFNSAQYFAIVLFAPLLGYIVHAYGWQSAFLFMGVVGLAFLVCVLKCVHEPRKSPYVNQAELDYIAGGGALVETNQSAGNRQNQGPYATCLLLSRLLRSRMLLGVYLGQYCINAITFFFLTWFPVYLVEARGMTILTAGAAAALPAMCGFIGGNLGGLFSDYLFKRGATLSVARKLPIVIGMLLSTSMIGCNYTRVEAVAIALMAVSYFGKGVGALGWAVNADTAPKEATGLSSGLFNTFGNLSSVITPIAIGYIIQSTGSFDWALVFVSVHAVLAIVSYLFLVGKIERLELISSASTLSTP